MTQRFSLSSKHTGDRAFGYIVGMFKNNYGEWVAYEDTDHDLVAREFYDEVRSMVRNMGYCWCDVQEYIENYMED